MATFREMAYMVLDLLKARSDDAYYTEEHALFIVSKMRAMLIEKKYRGARNSAYPVLSSENMQTLCLPVEPFRDMADCDGWLRTVSEVPAPLTDAQLTVHTVNDLRSMTVTFVAPERMPYVGYNRWLRNIIYCSRSSDGHLYFKGSDPRFMYLEKVTVNGVFSNPEEAARLACELDGKSCDILDLRFPLEEPLVAQCVELAFQELSGVRYAPEDKRNDAKDGLGEAGVIKSAASPASKAGEDGK